MGFKANGSKHSTVHQLSGASGHKTWVRNFSHFRPTRNKKNTKTCEVEEDVATWHAPTNLLQLGPVSANDASLTALDRGGSFVKFPRISLDFCFFWFVNNTYPELSSLGFST